MSSSSADNSPLVSVCMITYNHAGYIAQAIDSVLMQQVDFKLELVISDDCSKDTTAEVIKDYAKRYPDLIVATLNKENIGMAENLKAAFSYCKGKYIAMLEGDDYWSDPLKLKKQVLHLQNNSNLSAVCHNVVSLYENGDQRIRFSDKNCPKEILTLDDMLRLNWASTPTVMIRADVVKSFPDEVFRERVIDYYMWCFACTIGPIGYRHEVMSVYRVHGSGAWSKNTLKDRVMFETGNKIKAVRMFCKNEKIREEKVDNLNVELIKNLKSEGLKKDAFKTSIRFFFSYLFRFKFSTCGKFFPTGI